MNDLYVSSPQIRASRLAAAALVAANLVMLVTAAFQEWGYQILLAVFWWETVIIGVFNVFRIFTVCVAGEPLGGRIGLSTGSRVMLALVLNGFFIAKFGGFALGLGLLVFMAPSVLTNAGETHDFKESLDALPAVAHAVLPVVAALFSSHGVSFVQNFIRRREYRRSGILYLLFWPYARLSLLMVVLILGFAAVRGAPALARVPLFTAAVIVIKLLVDLATHRLEHRGSKPEEAVCTESWTPTR